MCGTFSRKLKCYEVKFQFIIVFWWAETALRSLPAAADEVLRCCPQMDCKVKPCNDGGGGEVIGEKYVVTGFEAVCGFLHVSAILHRHRRT
jgi:hypothetical protein